ncbi:MAG: aromatic-ring-hydroxylating dioxygenase subunit beta [Rhodococcus sp. (in: high G+C Gram-positive bacteria)]|uniref:aromatic-ring-hydroxylating dioxygenase subunit beta n=1 Tax=Rhodococcus sp. TaxID=1831 RepID=UPI003BAF5D61
MTGILTPAVSNMETTHEVQCFLNYEAELLDGWHLDEWLMLITEDCRYLVPPTDTHDSETPDQTVFIIADSYAQICGRVERLLSGKAFVEQPRSRTRRLITNVRVRETGPNKYEVRSNFAVYRYRRGVSNVFTGEYRHLLDRESDGSFRIRERRATLDCDVLRPQGKISFIL